MYFFLKNSGELKHLTFFSGILTIFKKVPDFHNFLKKIKKKINKHYRIRINDILPIAVIYFCTFPNFEALKCMIL